MFSSEVATQSKGDRTRARIRDIALASFRERGFDATTIRLIATEAGVSVGTVNFHFASKNELVQELYLEVQLAHRESALPLLVDSSTLVDRLGIVFREGLKQWQPYRAHASEFLSAAVSPRSPINPLSSESGAALQIVEDLFRTAIEGSAHRLPTDTVAALPRALALANLLLAMFWVYDSSPKHQRTEALLARSLTLLGAVLPLSRVPLVRAPLREFLKLVSEVGT